MIQFQNVCKRFPNGTVALDDVSLEVPAGQFCVLLGPSAAGKSTLLRLTNGLLEASKGNVQIDGVILNRRTRRRVQPRLSMIHQQFNLTPRLSVLDNVLCGTLARLPTWRALLRWFRLLDARRACELLDEVGLGEEHLYRRAMHLSGGQQQRVAIARAFILNPILVLADEPVASLDPRLSHTILDLLKRESRQHGATVLCSLHQIELALDFADRLIGLHKGKVVFDGPPESFDESNRRLIYGHETEDEKHGDAFPHGIMPGKPS